MVFSVSKIRALWLHKREDVLAKLKSAGIYMLIPIVNLGVSVFTTPLFAKHLTIEEFGYFGYYLSITNFLNILYGLSLNTFYMSMYYRGDLADRKKLLASLTLFSLGLNLVIFPVTYLALYFYFKLSASSIPFLPFALLSLTACVIGVYKNFVQTNYKLENKPVKYTVFVLSYRVLSTLVSLYLLIYLQIGLTGRLAGILIIELIFFALTMRDIFSGVSLAINKSDIRKAFRFILPLLPGSLLFLPLGSYDNIVLEKLHEPAHLGLYNLGKSIAYYLYLTFFSCYQVFEPEIYKAAVKLETRALKKVFYVLSFLIVSGVLAFWLLSHFLVDYLTAGKYIGAVHYANIWAVTNGLIIFFSFFDAIMLALQKSRQSLLIHLAAAILCLVSYTMMSKYLRQEGVAYAAAMTYLLLIIMQLVYIVQLFKRKHSPLTATAL